MAGASTTVSVDVAAPESLENALRKVPSGSTLSSTILLMSKLRMSLTELRNSSRLASFTISSTWVRNSAAMPRAFFTMSVTALMATGRSLAR